MKKLTVKKGIECMACLGCVNACSLTYAKEMNPLKAYIQITEKDGKVKPVVCIQCGKCASVCEQGAITQNAKGTYMINKKLCIGCGKCAEVCPLKVIVINDGKAGKCIACGICAKNCPMEMLEVVEQ